MSPKIGNSSRREFIKVAGLTATYIGTGSLSLQSCSQKVAHQHAQDLFNIFKDPNKDAKPFFRWWWNGNNVTSDEITRELEMIQKAGAGGVEINPIAMPEQAGNPEEGLVWLSDEWCQMLVHAVKESERLNLITDLIVGTGWPFGGEFIEPEETLQGLTYETIGLKGPGSRTVKIELPVDDHEKIINIILIPIPVEELHSARILTGDLDSNGNLIIDLPTGNYTLMTIKWRNKFRTVYHGAPGGAGAVLDHFNEQAVRKYLDHMSDKIKPYFDDNIGNGIRSLFCDSIELAGANWTDDLMAEFRKRRGYDIEPYLPFLHLDNQFTETQLRDTIRRVRYDFSLTLAELFMERFVTTYHDWCRNNETLSRYQAYGHPWLYMDMIDGYMIPDIPEGDQWLFNSGWCLAKIDEIRYGIWNKYASSGGHLAGKRIISSESMTNTSGVFRASLEYIKQATDLNFVAGVNHLILHGYNYSPPQAGFPGWVRYGCYFNEQNTWWKFFPLWAEYASRISALLQATDPVSQAALLGPTPDVWSDYGLDRNPFNMTPWYLHSFWQALNHNGICSDYINGQIIKDAEMREGRMRYGKMYYDILLICDVETIDPEVLAGISEFINHGLRIIFIGKKPKFAPGLADHSNRDALVSDTFNKIMASGAIYIEEPVQEKTDPHQGLSDWTKDLINSSDIRKGISIIPNDPALFYIQRKYGDLDLFFFSNSDRKRTLKIELGFRINSKKIWRWCPEALTREIVHDDSGYPFNLEFTPLESVLLILDPSSGGKREVLEKVNELPAFRISGNWKVSGVHYINHSEFNLQLDELVDLCSHKGLESFAGEAYYSIQFDLSLLTYTKIDLGEVFDIAEVNINNDKIGIRWWGKKPLTIPPGLLKKHGNDLVIKVYNRLYNYCSSMKDNATDSHWVSQNRHKTRLPAGLIGPVVLY